MGFKTLNEHKGIIILIFFFVLANAVFLGFYNDVWWDSSVYIGMGKYIFSYGNSGLWEESRPLVLPFLLGIGWWLKLDVVLFGRILSVLFAASVLVMAYIIGARLSSKRAGLASAFFLAFSYTFFFFSSNMLTEIPSIFFILLSFYLFLENRFFWMGFFSGIAVMTRFFQLFTIIGILAVFLVYFYNKKGFYRKLIYFSVGFAIIVVPFVAFSYHSYGDFLTPIKVQMHLSRTTGWANYSEYWYYFSGLLKENFMFLFLLAIPFFFRKDYRLYALISAPLLHLIVFSVVKQKEMRYALLAIPFLCILLGYCLEQVYSKIRNKRIAVDIFYAMSVIFLFLSFASLSSALDYRQSDNEGLRHFQEYLKDKGGNIWITNPIYAIHSDAKISGLLYYRSSANLIRFLEGNDADIVLFNECDIPCAPAELDKECKDSRKALNKKLSGMKLAYDRKVDSCRYRIFTS